VGRIAGAISKWGIGEKGSNKRAVKGGTIPQITKETQKQYTARNTKLLLEE